MAAGQVVVLAEAQGPVAQDVAVPQVGVVEPRDVEQVAERVVYKPVEQDAGMLPVRDVVPVLRHWATWQDATVGRS